MYCVSHATASAAAQANANATRVPWIVFTDSSGNWRCEKLSSTRPDSSVRVGGQVFNPQEE
jgi:hypothetical protein